MNQNQSGHAASFLSRAQFLRLEYLTSNMMVGWKVLRVAVLDLGKMALSTFEALCHIKGNAFEFSEAFSGWWSQ